jgi:hypothetical protein
MNIRGNDSMFRYVFFAGLIISVPLSAQAFAANAQEPAISDPAIKPRAPTLPVFTDDTDLFETFGGREGLTRIMDAFMVRLVKNPRTRPFFENADQERIKRQLVEQFCVIMKGPCEYSGRTMAIADRIYPRALSTRWSRSCSSRSTRWTYPSGPRTA